MTEAHGVLGSTPRGPIFLKMDFENKEYDFEIKHLKPIVGLYNYLDKVIKVSKKNNYIHPKIAFVGTGLGVFNGLVASPFVFGALKGIEYIVDKF